MALVDIKCFTCGYQEIDHFIGVGLIPKGWIPPDCPKCLIQMARTDKGKSNCPEIIFKGSTRKGGIR